MRPPHFLAELGSLIILAAPLLFSARFSTRGRGGVREVERMRVHRERVAAEVERQGRVALVYEAVRVPRHAPPHHLLLFFQV